MSKYNCDVCGTAYPDSSTQCPICGCVRSIDALTDSDKQNRSYTYVKGGRFSKTNVRKRNDGMPAYQLEASGDPYSQDENSDTGLVVAVCVLLLAIIAVVIYIITKFFSVELPANQKGPVLPPLTTNESIVATTTAEETTVIPETSETVEYTEPEESTTEPETEPVDPYAAYVRPFKINKSDVTLQLSSSIGKSFELLLKDAKGNVVEVDWVLTDPEICKVEGNTITAAKTGKVRAAVVIDGVTYSCIVRVVP